MNPIRVNTDGPDAAFLQSLGNDRFGLGTLGAYAGGTHGSSALPP